MQNYAYLHFSCFLMCNFIIRFDYLTFLCYQVSPSGNKREITQKYIKIQSFSVKKVAFINYQKAMVHSFTRYIIKLNLFLLIFQKYVLLFFETVSLGEMKYICFYMHNTNNTGLYQALYKIINVDQVDAVQF